MSRNKRKLAGRFAAAIAVIGLALPAAWGGDKSAGSNSVAQADRGREKGGTITIETIASWVQALHHPDYQTRAEAVDRLAKVDPKHLPSLVEFYHAQNDHERKLQLRRVIEQVYYRKQMQGQVGFIGIRPAVADAIYDPATGQLAECILVVQALDGFPAKRAGIRQGDLMVAFDHKPLSEIFRKRVARQGLKPGVQAQAQAMMEGRLVLGEPRNEAFMTEVKQRKPGSKIPIRIVRLDLAARHIAVPAGEKAEGFLEGLALRRAMVPDIPALLARPSTRMIPVLVATGVAKGSVAAKLGIRPNDVIVAINNEEVKVTNSEEALEKMLKATRIPDRTLLSVSRLQSEEIVLSLGGRPVDLLNPLDMAVAQLRFTAWWLEQSGQRLLRGPDTLTSEIRSGMFRGAVAVDENKASVLP